MGTLTLTELKEEVKAGLANRADLDSRLTRFINLAQQRVSRLHNFDEMEVISTQDLPYTDTISDKYVTLPNIRELHLFKIINGQQSAKLTGLTARRFNRMIPAPQELARSQPRIYTIWNYTTIIYPLPEQVYNAEIWWTKWPTAFLDENPTSTSDYKEKDEILIELALVYAKNSLGTVEEAQKHWARVRPMLIEAVNTDQEKPDQDVFPGPGERDTESMLPGEYWNDPFTRTQP